MACCAKKRKLKVLVKQSDDVTLDFVNVDQSQGVAFVDFVDSHFRSRDRQKSCFGLISGPGTIPLAAGDKEVADSLKNKISSQNDGIIITPGFRLSKYIVHSVVPGSVEADQARVRLIKSYKTILNLALQRIGDIKTLVIPALYEGYKDQDVKEAATLAFQTFGKFISDHIDADLRIVLTYKNEELRDFFRGLTSKYLDPKT